MTGIMKVGAALGLDRWSAPLSEDLDWQLKGACRGADTRLFYPKSPDQERKSRVAKAICADCPVMLECRAWALTEGEEHGVWGGLSENEREVWSRMPAADRLRVLAGAPVTKEVKKRRYHRRTAQAMWGIDDDW